MTTETDTSSKEVSREKKKWYRLIDLLSCSVVVMFAATLWLAIRHLEKADVLAVMVLLAGLLFFVAVSARLGASAILQKLE